jgi:hypothetical protein
MDFVNLSEIEQTKRAKSLHLVCFCRQNNPQRRQNYPQRRQNGAVTTRKKRTPGVNRESPKEIEEWSTLLID